MATHRIPGYVTVELPDACDDARGPATGSADTTRRPMVVTDPCCKKQAWWPTITLAGIVAFLGAVVLAIVVSAGLLGVAHYYKELRQNEQIAELQNQHNRLSGAQNALADQVDVLDRQVKDIDRRVVTTDSTITSLKGVVDAQGKTIEGIVPKFVALEGRVGKVESEQTTLSARLDTEVSDRKEAVSASRRSFNAKFGALNQRLGVASAPMEYRLPAVGANEALMVRVTGAVPGTRVDTFAVPVARQ